MGIYACAECFQKHGFEVAPVQFSLHGSCETCGHLRDDWRQKTVTYTHDVSRDTVGYGPIAEQLRTRRSAPM